MAVGEYAIVRASQFQKQRRTLEKSSGRLKELTAVFHATETSEAIACKLRSSKLDIVVVNTVTKELQETIVELKKVVAAVGEHDLGDLRKDSDQE